MNKMINKIISNNSFEIDIEAPKNAKGIEPIKYGTSKLRLRFPDLTQLIEFPDTTIILQHNANIGMM